MIKKCIKYLIIFILIVFLFLFNFGGLIYKNKITKKKELTEEQIKKFEQDIKDGKQIDIDEYVVKENNYQNRVTKYNSDISHMIEKIFRKLFEHFIKKIDI